MNFNRKQTRVTVTWEIYGRVTRYSSSRRRHSNLNGNHRLSYSLVLITIEAEAERQVLSKTLGQNCKIKHRSLFVKIILLVKWLIHESLSRYVVCRPNASHLTLLLDRLRRRRRFLWSGGTNPLLGLDASLVLTQRLYLVRVCLRLWRIFRRGGILPLATIFGVSRWLQISSTLRTHMRQSTPP